MQESATSTSSSAAARDAIVMVEAGANEVGEDEAARGPASRPRGDQEAHRRAARAAELGRQAQVGGRRGRRSTRASTTRSWPVSAPRSTRVTQIVDKKEREDATERRCARRSSRRSRRGDDVDPERPHQVKRAFAQLEQGHHPAPHRRREAPPRRPRPPTRSAQITSEVGVIAAHRTAAPCSRAARRRP